MTSSSPTPYRHLGGALPLEDPTYVVRNADGELYQALRNREFCYVLNSRQMGKSSLRVRVMQQLKADGMTCGVVDLSAMGTESTESAWYKGLAYRIMRNFRAAKSGKKVRGEAPFDWRQWWHDHDFLSPVQQLAELIQAVLLATVEGEIVIFIDEIDSVLSLGFSTDDFFAWIRSCYNNRADHADYQRLTFCLLGVATPGDLITDKKRTPFNLGRAIALSGFEFHQAQTALQPGLTQAEIPAPETVLQHILHWTGGQPFLTQKLCQLVVSHWPSMGSQAPTSAVDAIVQAHILTNWESQDEPEHLRTIRDRFYAHPEKTNRLLGLYQQILFRGRLTLDDSPEQRELRLTGATVKRQNSLQVFNPIYRHIFDGAWVSQALAHIRPYAQSIDGWLQSNRQDATYLLTGAALAEAKAWASGKSLSDQDYAYLAACQETETLQAEAALALEAQAKQVLAEANQKAHRRIRIGVGVLGLAAALLTGSIVFSARTVQSARGEASTAQSAAEQARLAALDSEAVAAAEKENARLARHAVDNARQEIRAANTTSRLAREAAQRALADADMAAQTAQQAQQAAASARAETTQAFTQRNQAEQQVAQAKVSLATANQQLTRAEAERRELTLGTQLERSALALMRTSPRPTTDTLIEAVRLGETLHPFLADGRSVSRYPAVAPILALQTMLANISKFGAVSPLGPARDTSLQEPVTAWFSADARRYATLHSYDGFRAIYLQFWNHRGEPIGQSVDVGSGDVPRPLSFYLLSDQALSRDQESELLAIQCGSQTICIKDFDQNLDHRQLEQVPGEQAAFNPEKKELITVDQNHVLRRWTLFDQGRWIGQPIAEVQLPIQTDQVYLTADGRHVWTYQHQPGQPGQIHVFDLAGQWIKTHPNPMPGSAPSPSLAFSPDGDLVGQIDLTELPGQGRQLWSLPVDNAELLADLQLNFVQAQGHISVVKPLPPQPGDGVNGSVFQRYDGAGQLVSEDIAQDQSITVLPQPQGDFFATLECAVTAMAPQGCTGKVWDAENQVIHSMEVLAGGLQWTPQGNYLATWDNEQLRLLNINQLNTSTYATGGNLHAFQPGQTAANEPLYFWIRQGPGLELWSTAAQAPLATAYALGLNAMVVAARYDPLSQTIFAVSDHVEHGASLIAQSVHPEDELAEPRINFGRGRDWVFSPQGNHIAVSKPNGDLQLWSLDGNLEASFVGHAGAIDQVRFSPDGHQILTYSGMDKTVRLWDLQGRQMAQYDSAIAPTINADWSQLITLEQRPSLHPQIPETQLNVWSIDSLETLLAEACHRLEPYLSSTSDQEERLVCN
jgi:WD40 repeat protein